jgi:hypothetical protein
MRKVLTTSLIALFFSIGTLAGVAQAQECKSYTNKASCTADKACNWTVKNNCKKVKK